MLTLDFLARQLLQALVMRLRFRTGASDMAVVSEVGEAGRVAYLGCVRSTGGGGGFTRSLQEPTDPPQPIVPVSRRSAH